MKNFSLILSIFFTFLGTAFGQELTDAQRALLENENILSNPGFESGKTGWTISGTATPSVSSSSSQVIRGKRSLCFTAAAQTFTLTQDSTKYASVLNGANGYTRTRISSTHDAPITLCSRNAGSTSASNCVDVYRNGIPMLNKISTIFGATSNGISISAASGSGVTCIDQVFVGMSELKAEASAVGPWVDYGAINISATTTAPTKATTREQDSVKCRVVGQDYECQYLYKAASATGAATGSGGYVFNLPSGIVLDSSIPTVSNSTGSFAYAGSHTIANIGYGDIEYSSNGDTGGKCDVFATSTTTFQTACFIGATSVLVPSSTNASINNADYGFKFTLKFRGAGLQSNFNTYSATNANYSRTAYTPIFTGLGTTSSVDCGHSRTGQYLDLDCKWTSVSATASEARVSLPTVSGVALTPAISSIRGFGTASLSVVGDQAISVLAEPGNNYVTFGFQGASGAGLSKQTGSGWIGTGTITVSFTARIPISQWDNSNLIFGSFSEIPTTRGSNGVDIQMVLFGAGSDCSTVCSSGNCTICKQTGNKITSVSFVSTGTYNINGIDGTKYACTGSAETSQYGGLVHKYGQSTSSFARMVGGTTSPGNVANGTAICVGIP